MGLDLLTANDRSGVHAASWYAESADVPPPAPSLTGEVTADVVVVGGGYTGLSAALHLAEAGYDVVLLEANRLGWGASGRNGGQVSPGQRRDQVWLERVAGAVRARAFWDLALEAHGLVRGLIARHAIACELKDGVVEAAHRRGDAVGMADYAEHLARVYGYARTEPLDRAGVAAALGTKAYHGGLWFPEAAHLHPLAYALGLGRAAAGAGVRIHEGSRVLRRQGWRVETAAGWVGARHVVVACNGYLGGLEPAAAARIMPINNFIIATEPMGEARAAALIPRDVAAADTRFVVNYWRLTADRRLLFGGGETHGWRFPADIAGLVRPRMLEVYPSLADLAITHAWGGTLAITTNRMPAFQRLDDVALAAGGYSGHGVAIATLAGKLIAEALRGSAERFDLFATLPQREFPGGALLRWPLLALAMGWYALRDRL